VAADQVQAVLDRALADVAGARSTSDLEQVRVRVLGRSGELTGLLRALGGIPASERPRVGQEANRAKGRVEAAIAERQEALRTAEHRQSLDASTLDLTLPGRYTPPGPVHLITRVMDEIIEIFEGLGFSVAEGPEVETDYYNFSALNFPDDHPARDMQDTLYLAKPWARPAETVRGGGASALPAPAQPATLLRTHTSAMQIRYMESHTPPVRVIAPGRVYRRDNLDLTHTPMFQQVEGLVVGEGVTMGDLKGTLIGFLRELFTPETPVVFRPSFFPYTEPSADVFIGCQQCHGSGCAMCKRTGFIEVLGCGMVHPAVFEAVGYDATKVTGFAFGVGIERLALLMHGVEDIRLFYENDLRFLEQFPQ